MACSRRLFSFLLSTLGLIILLACGPAAPQTVLSTNFEDGMTDRWIPRGTGTTPTNIALQANIAILGDIPFTPTNGPEVRFGTRSPFRASVRIAIWHLPVSWPFPISKGICLALHS